MSKSARAAGCAILAAAMVLIGGRAWAGWALDGARSDGGAGATPAGTGGGEVTAYLEESMTQTVAVVGITATNVWVDTLVVTAIHDAGVPYTATPYYLLDAHEEAVYMYREEVQAEYFFVTYDGMRSQWVMTMQDLGTWTYLGSTNLSELAGTYTADLNTDATGTVDIASWATTTSSVYAVTGSSQVNTNVQYQVATNQVEADAGFYPVFEVRVPYQSPGEMGSYWLTDFVIEASTNGFQSRCYYYNSLGSRPCNWAGQAWAPTGWQTLDGADPRGIVLFHGSAYGMLEERIYQKAFDASLYYASGSGYMFGSPVLFMPMALAPWMRRDNPELLWRILRVNDAALSAFPNEEGQWNLIRPCEWRVKPIRYRELAYSTAWPTE